MLQLSNLGSYLIEKKINKYIHKKNKNKNNVLIIAFPHGDIDTPYDNHQYVLRYGLCVSVRDKINCMHIMYFWEQVYLDCKTYCSLISLDE